MPARTIAQNNEAILVVVDEQERLGAVMERRASVVGATQRLVRAAALVSVPLVVTRQYPKGLGDTEPAIIEAAARAEEGGTGVARVDKVAFDCFAESRFVEALAHTGRNQLVLVGMETHICIVQTALSALRAGFDVHVVADACCSRDAGSHTLALQRMGAAGAVVTTSESVMYELVGEAGTDEFRALLGIVKE